MHRLVKQNKLIFQEDIWWQVYSYEYVCTDKFGDNDTYFGHLDSYELTGNTDANASGLKILITRSFSVTVFSRLLLPDYINHHHD